MANELDRAIAELRREMQRRDRDCAGGNSDRDTRTSEQFDDAARAVHNEIRRMRDVASDIERELDQMRWRGESATYFRARAREQRARINHSIEVMESLRSLLLRAADVARHARAKAGVA